MFDNLGGGELLLILLVVLIFFGPKKIPELATSMGKGLRKFREAKEGLEDQLKTAIKEPVEALQAAKSNFDMHVQAVAQPVKEAAKSFEANLPNAQTPIPASPPVSENPAP
jgi:sec-independent protein translocase protein TatA